MKQGSRSLVLLMCLVAAATSFIGTAVVAHPLGAPVGRQFERSPDRELGLVGSDPHFERRAHVHSSEQKAEEQHIARLEQELPASATQLDFGMCCFAVCKLWFGKWFYIIN